MRGVVTVITAVSGSCAAAVAMIVSVPGSKASTL